VLFVPMKWGPQVLTVWEPILGKASLARISTIARKRAPFVLAAQRSPKSTIYVFVGQSEREFMALADSFLHAEEAFTELPGPG
jgi:hypothetical protein